ncbi:hypothetical protein EKK58_06575 [Candidatus Dependentiae bacterium]|nr:MAG: hypothetical protein EKK58_06575 [Candidatus Dependentiae bacterium]
MNKVKKLTIFNTLLCILIGSQALVLAESTNFPPIDPRLQELYQELQQEEDAVLKKFKAAYPNVPEAVWQRYYELPKEGFAAIKKEYAGTPACNGLPENVNWWWSEKRYGIFLEQYTQCAAERNGIDPTKINILYDYNDNKRFENYKNTYVGSCGFDYFPKKVGSYYVLATEHKIERPHLLVNKDVFYRNRGDSQLYHNFMNNTMIDQNIAQISNSSNQYDFLHYVVKRYYGQEALNQEQFKKLKQEWSDVHNNNSYVIATMNSEDVMHRVIQYASQEKQPVFSESDAKRDWKKILAYVLKIKKILHG